jgi:hypothetical protein
LSSWPASGHLVDLSLLKIRALSRLGVVAHAYNPRYLGGRDQEQHSSKPTPGKKLVRPPPISDNKLRVVMHAYHPSYTRDINRRILVQASLGNNTRPYLKKSD